MPYYYNKKSSPVLSIYTIHNKWYIFHSQRASFASPKLTFSYSEPDIWWIWHFTVDDRKWKKHKPPTPSSAFIILSWLDIIFFSSLKISKTFYTVVIRPKSVSLRLERIPLRKCWKCDWKENGWEESKHLWCYFFDKVSAQLPRYHSKE